MANLTPPQWANLEFLVIASNPQYIADPDNPGDLIVQPGWIELTTVEALEAAQIEIEALTPPPVPVADWVVFMVATRSQYAALLSQSTAGFGEKAILQNWIARVPIPPESAPLFIHDWNAVAALLPEAHGIDFAAVAAAAVANNCPLFDTINTTTGILTIPA